MSKIEERVAKKLQVKKRDVNIPFQLYDAEDTPFFAKADQLFIDDEGIITFVELKEYPSNARGNIRVCTNRLREQCEHRGLSSEGNHNHLSRRLYFAGHNKDCLDHAWNHSLAKHVIVNQALREKNYRYIVVFSKHAPTVGEKEKPWRIHYQMKGLTEVMLENEFIKQATTWTPLSKLPNNAEAA